MIREIFDNQYFLLPGDMVVTKKAITISTILGSCVAVCLFDPVKKIAGMNHFLLPFNEYNDKELLKFGNTSLASMLTKMEGLGADINRITASVAGGSSMFNTGSDRFNIGKSNIDAALEFLKNRQMKVVLNETGGTYGRKIIFHTHDGRVECRSLKK